MISGDLFSDFAHRKINISASLATLSHDFYILWVIYGFSAIDGGSEIPRKAGKVLLPSRGWVGVGLYLNAEETLETRQPRLDDPSSPEDEAQRRRVLARQLRKGWKAFPAISEDFNSKIYGRWNPQPSSEKLGVKFF